MNGAMVPVTPAEHVKMTVKSGKAPEDSNVFTYFAHPFFAGLQKNMLFFVTHLQNKGDVFVWGDWVILVLQTREFHRQVPRHEVGILFLTPKCWQIEDPWNLMIWGLTNGTWDVHPFWKRNIIFHQTSMTLGFQPLVVGESTDQLLYMWIWVASKLDEWHWKFPFKTKGKSWCYVDVIPSNGN